MNIVNYKLNALFLVQNLHFYPHRLFDLEGRGGGGGGVGSGVGSSGGGGVGSSVGSGVGGGIPLDSILAPLPRPYFFFDSGVCLTFL